MLQSIGHPAGQGFEFRLLAPASRLYKSSQATHLETFSKDSKD
jgi:hypothetical protein